MTPPENSESSPNARKFDLTTELAIAGAALASIGVVHAAVLSLFLQINLFDYASATDFVAFAFRNWLAILFGVGVALLAHFHNQSRAIQFALVMGVSVATSAAYTAVDAVSLLSGRGRLMAGNPCTISLSTETIGRATPIGAAGQYFIIFEDRKMTTRMIANSDIKAIDCRKSR